MVCNLVPGAISTLMKFGSEAQQHTWIPRLVSGDVLSTMCLTEPGAGSDLSRIRTKATREGDDDPAPDQHRAERPVAGLLQPVAEIDAVPNLDVCCWTAPLHASRAVLPEDNPG